MNIKKTVAKLEAVKIPGKRIEKQIHNLEEQRKLSALQGFQRELLRGTLRVEPPKNPSKGRKRHVGNPGKVEVQSEVLAS